jgi:hypothetical protein
VEEGVTPYADNTPKTIVPIYYPLNAEKDQFVTIRYQLLDMWGRPTIRAGATVEAICCNALGVIGEDENSATSLRTETLSDSDGQVTFVYKGTELGTETILVRVVE